MERETKEISFGKHKAVVKTYATAREHQTIQKALLKDAKFDVVGETPKLNDFDPTVLFSLHEEMVRQMVVSLDGSAEQIVDRYLDLPSADAEELVKVLDELVSKKNS